jgi:glycosyltransferase involved in cell wall biosynthesis
MSKMRIMHIASGDLLAGAEVQLYTLLKYLKKNPETELVAVLMNHGELEQRLRALAIEVHVIDESRHHAWAIFKILRQLIKSRQPDIIHTHRIKENILGSLANRFSLNKPCVKTAHGLPEHKGGGYQQLLRVLDNWTGRWLQDRVIAVSKELGEQLENLYPTRHIAVIHNGVEPPKSETKTLTDFKQNNPSFSHIGLAGRLESVKRADLFLAIANELITEHDQRWQFHLFGDGSQMPKLKTMAEKLGIQKNVIFHGHRDDIHNCLASLDVLVMCSDHEGLPMTALESLALGTPIVAHRVGGLTELLQKQKSCRLVDKQDIHSYCQAIEAILTDRLEPSKKQSLLEEKYLASSNAEMTLAMYAALCEPLFSVRSKPG